MVKTNDLIAIAVIGVLAYAVYLKFTAQRQNIGYNFSTPQPVTTLNDDLNRTVVPSLQGTVIGNLIKFNPFNIASSAITKVLLGGFRR